MIYDGEAIISTKQVLQTNDFARSAGSKKRRLQYEEEQRLQMKAGASAISMLEEEQQPPAGSMLALLMCPSEDLNRGCQAFEWDEHTRRKFCIAAFTGKTKTLIVFDCDHGFILQRDWQRAHPWR